LGNLLVARLHDLGESRESAERQPGLVRVRIDDDNRRRSKLQVAHDLSATQTWPRRRRVRELGDDKSRRRLTSGEGVNLAGVAPGEDRAERGDLAQVRGNLLGVGRFAGGSAFEGGPSKLDELEIR